MNLTDVIGYCAATLTTLSFLPQVIQALRTKDLRSISLSMYIAFCAGITLWLVYGLMLHAWPIVIANIFTLALSGMVLTLKIKQILLNKRSARPPINSKNT
jgi:MtN3 and saliva related transmembrane protein